MYTSKTRLASHLTLALGGLLMAAAASATDAQSQAQAVLIGQPSTHIVGSEAATIISGSARIVSGSTSRVRTDAQHQAAAVLNGPSQEIGKSATTRVALRATSASGTAYRRQFSNSQEMAQKVVLGVGGE